MPAPTARTLAATETLIEAGRMLATLADPARDLHDIGGDFTELAETLRLIGGGLRDAQERADDIRDGRLDNLAAGRLWHADGRNWTRDEVELAYRNEIVAARRTAARTAQLALVELARVIHELEIG